MNTSKLRAYTINKGRLILKRLASFNVKMSYGGEHLKIPILEGVGLNNLDKGHESSTGFIIDRILRKRSGAFIDVGANIGQTLLKVLAADRDRRYIGFEVHTFCCYYLERLFEINQLRNCTILPVGISSEKKLVPLFYSALDDSGASTVEGFRMRKYATAKLVLLDKGDDILAKLQIDDLAAIKVDVEGGESEVLYGFRETIGKYRPLMIIEVLPMSQIAVNPSMTEAEKASMIGLRKRNMERIQDLLKELSYKAFRILPDNSLQQVDGFDYQGKFNLELCNYLLIHALDEAAFQDIIKA